MKRRRTAQEIDELVESYRVSGMTRIAYCQQVGLALSTLGRYLRQRSGSQRLVRVKVDTAMEPCPSFVQREQRAVIGRLHRGLPVLAGGAKLSHSSCSPSLDYRVPNAGT